MCSCSLLSFFFIGSLCVSGLAGNIDITGIRISDDVVDVSGGARLVEVEVDFTSEDGLTSAEGRFDLTEASGSELGWATDVYPGLWIGGLNPASLLSGDRYEGTLLGSFWAMLNSPPGTHTLYVGLRDGTGGVAGTDPIFGSALLNPDLDTSLQVVNPGYHFGVETGAEAASGKFAERVIDVSAGAASAMFEVEMLERARGISPAPIRVGQAPADFMVRRVGDSVSGDVVRLVADDIEWVEGGLWHAFFRGKIVVPPYTPPGVIEVHSGLYQRAIRGVGSAQALGGVAFHPWSTPRVEIRNSGPVDDRLPIVVNAGFGVSSVDVSEGAVEVPVWVEFDSGVAPLLELTVSVWDVLVPTYGLLKFVPGGEVAGDSHAGRYEGLLEIPDSMPAGIHELSVGMKDAGEKTAFYGGDLSLLPLPGGASISVVNSSPELPNHSAGIPPVGRIILVGDTGEITPELRIIGEGEEIDVAGGVSIPVSVSWETVGRPITAVSVRLDGSLFRMIEARMPVVPAISGSIDFQIAAPGNLLPGDYAVTLWLTDDTGKHIAFGGVGGVFPVIPNGGVRKLELVNSDPRWSLEGVPESAFENWVSEFPELPLAARGWYSDFDRDGRNNLLERAQGGDPSDPASPPDVTSGDDFGSYRFPVSEDGVFEGVRFEVSSDGVNWAEVEPGDLGEGFIEVDVPEGKRGFSRMAVDRPTP